MSHDVPSTGSNIIDRASELLVLSLLIADDNGGGINGYSLGRPQIDKLNSSIVCLSMVTWSTGSGRKPRQEQPGWADRLRSDLEHNENFEPNNMDAPNRDYRDAPNLDTARERGGALRLNPDRSDRPFLEDDASMVEDDASMSVEDDVSTSLGPSLTKRIFRALAGLSFLVLLGAGGALAWRSYGDQAMDLISAWALPSSTSKPAAPRLDAAEIQQQFMSIASDLAAMRHALEQLTANQDQLARKQEEMTRTQEQMANSIAVQAAKQELSQKLSSPPPAKPVLSPPKPVQHPAQLSSQASSRPPHLPPPQSLQPPDTK